MKKLNSIELFAGAGGLVDGFEQTNYYNLIAAVEWKKPQVDTLINRLETKYKFVDAKKRILNFDIQRTKELLYGWEEDPLFGTNLGLINLVGKKKIDIISGGPPCQAYSLAGRIRDHNNMKNDYRNFLFEAYIRVVDFFQPKIIVFENVEGILSAIPSGDKIVDLIHKSFNQSNYEIVDDLKKYALFDLCDFGVPQKRKRVIIVGVRRDVRNVNYQNLLKDFYDDLSSEKVSLVNNVKDAIFDLPPIYPLNNPIKRIAYDNNNGINGHNARFHSKRDQEIFFMLAKDIEDGTLKYNSSDKLIELYYEKTGKKTNVHKYNVLKWDEPSNTIPAHLKKDGLRHIHPDSSQRRSITVREAARLQTFDDDFEFNESQQANFEMIGNAVPPLFARTLGHLIPEFMRKIIKEEDEKSLEED